MILYFVWGHAKQTDHVFHTQVTTLFINPFLGSGIINA